MDKIMKIWQFLDGKKTAIGMAAILLAGAISAFYTNSGLDPAPVVNGIVGVLRYAGEALGAVGLAHKIVK